MKMITVALILLLASLTTVADSSLYERGKAYFYGEGVEQNYSKALLAFEQATKNNDLDAMTALGVMYIEGVGVDQDDTRGIEYLAKAADEAHPKAQYYLGAMYYLGIGVERDLTKAFGLIRL
jgi:uncharacterized protein